MGIKYSINQSELSKSIIGKKFYTKAAMCLGYHVSVENMLKYPENIIPMLDLKNLENVYDNHWYLGVWNVKPLSSNPLKDSVDIKIDDKICFIITDVTKTKNLLNGDHIVIKAKILNDVKLKRIKNNVRESIHDGEWRQRNIETATTKFISSIVDIQNKILLTKNLVVNLYYHHLGIIIPININNKYEYDKKIIVSDYIISEYESDIHNDSI